MKKIFVRGQISFSIDGHEVEFLDRDISVFGAAGLPWGGVDPIRHFGREVDLKIRITGMAKEVGVPAEEPVTLALKGRIWREVNPDGSIFGLRLVENVPTIDQLSKLIQARGHFPTEYARKYPRIPFVSKIPMFPQRAVFLPSQTNPELVGPFSAEIVNLSPEGMKVYTDSPLAPRLLPGAEVEFFMEPRGSFQLPVRVRGKICRAADELDPASGNSLHTFGIHFFRFESDSGAAFMELLKAILGRMAKLEG